MLELTEHTHMYTHTHTHTPITNFHQPAEEISPSSMPFRLSIPYDRLSAGVGSSHTFLFIETKESFWSEGTGALLDIQTCLTFCCFLKVKLASGTKIQQRERQSVLQERQTRRKERQDAFRCCGQEKQPTIPDSPLLWSMNV